MEPNDVEFKTVHGFFGSRARTKRVLEQESAAGWALYEKLDDSRLRLVRPRAAAANDDQLDLDPYRTRVGINPLQLTAGIMTASVAAALLVVLIGTR